MSILVLNSGSTSLKYKLFSKNSLKVLKSGNFQDLSKQSDHFIACKSIIKQIKSLPDIKIAGHRIVHGGNKFLKPTIINDSNFNILSKFNNLAPLHNPRQLKVLQLARKLLPNVSHLAVFDTSFFADLPEKAKVYAIPLKYYKKYGIQRFGFHGISHKYAAQQAAEKLKKRLNSINLITCHLGGGCSIVAIKGGRAIDTSMGFTPMSGLVMMSRCGDLDPALIFHLNHNFNLSNNKIYNLLNFESGIKGLFGKSNFLQLLKAVKKRNKKAQLAFDVFIYSIQKYISSYYGILGKVNAVVFTGAIGTGDPYTVQKIKQGLPIFKKTKILRINTNEEVAIAKECILLWNAKNRKI